MIVASKTRPGIDPCNEAGVARLHGSWTLAEAPEIAAALRNAPDATRCLDATGVEKRRRSRSKYGVKRPKAK